jgi:hypothetical protein
VPTAAHLLIRSRTQPTMIRPVAMTLIYQVFSNLLSWLVLGGRSDTAKRSGAHVVTIIGAEVPKGTCGVPEVGLGA